MRSLIIGVLFVGMWGVALAKLRNTHHDFSGAGWSGGEFCKPCHTPHNARVGVYPLWNRPDTSATFTLYGSFTMDATPGQPTGTTRLCLSCHDGTIAVDTYGSQTGSTFMSSYPFGNIGTDLSRHHPLSFVYDSALAATDGELADPATALSGLGGTIDQDLLKNGRLECTSCHDVHIGRATNGCMSCHFVAGVTTLSVSTWKSNTGSALCLTCHLK